MKYCGNCGAKLEADSKFCPECGKATTKPKTTKKETVKETTEERAKETVQENQTIEKAKETFEKFNNTKDDTKEFDKKDIDDNKALACLSYLGPLVFIPFFAVKNSKYAQYHAKEGINFLIYWAAFWVLHILLSLIKVRTLRHSNIFGYGYDYYVMATPIWIWLPLLLVELGFVAIAVIGIVNALQGKAKELPIFGKLKIIK